DPLLRCHPEAAAPIRAIVGDTTTGKTQQFPRAGGHEPRTDRHVELVTQTKQTGMIELIRAARARGIDITVPCLIAARQEGDGFHTADHRETEAEPCLDPVEHGMVSGAGRVAGDEIMPGIADISGIKIIDEGAVDIDTGRDAGTRGNQGADTDAKAGNEPALIIA